MLQDQEHGFRAEGLRADAHAVLRESRTRWRESRDRRCSVSQAFP